MNRANGLQPVSIIRVSGPFSATLVAALILTGCAINDVGASVDDTGNAFGVESGGRSVEEEFPEVARNCQIPAATVTRTRSANYLNLPADVYAARDRQPAAGHISCIVQWARERGLILTIDARN